MSRERPGTDRAVGARAREGAAMNGRHFEAVGARKLNVPDTFRWFRYEYIADATILTGCVSSGVVTRGPRKGRPRYDGDKQRVAVTDAEARAEFERYQAETGLCGECMGSGQRLKSWHHINGSTYRPCPKCDGLGKP